MSIQPDQSYTAVYLYDFIKSVVLDATLAYCHLAVIPHCKI